MSDLRVEYNIGAPTFAFQMPSIGRRLAWAGGMAGLGLFLGQFGFAEIPVLSTLALIAGLSANWSG